MASIGTDIISFMEKALYSVSAERRDRLKPALNEEVWSLFDLEPTLSEYLFGGNIIENFKSAKENYKLSHNLIIWYSFVPNCREGGGQTANFGKKSPT